MRNVISDWVHTEIITYKIWVNFIEKFEQTFISEWLCLLKKDDESLSTQIGRNWKIKSVFLQKTTYVQKYFCNYCTKQQKNNQMTQIAILLGFMVSSMRPAYATSSMIYIVQSLGAYFNAIRCTIGPSTLLSVHHQANACPMWHKDASDNIGIFVKFRNPAVILEVLI